MPKITKANALEIAKKLTNEPKRYERMAIQTVEGAKHTLVKVWHRKQWIGQFGIQRSSKGDSNHSDIAAQMHLDRDECMLFAQCPLSIDDYIALLVERKVIANK